MSVPEYVFLHRIQEFYDQLRAGRNLWKIDETLGFIDERGRNMIKKWVQDPRFPWTLGRGYTILMQPAPVISLVVDSDSDRSGGNFIGQYAGSGIVYDDDDEPKEYWEQSAKLKSGNFLFIFTAPNADTLTAMYALVERAMYEGEVPPINEENIITFSDYGIQELSYRGSDIRPDQNYIPTATFARTLSVTCSYMHTWTGRMFGKKDYLFSINIGDVYDKSDDYFIQRNPEPSFGVEPVIPVTTLPEPVLSQAPGISLSGKTEMGNVPTYLTTTGGPPSIDNMIIIPNNTVVTFEANITASSSGLTGAAWKISGAIRKGDTNETTELVGITGNEFISDPELQFATAEVVADSTNGTLMVIATGVVGITLNWGASIEIR